jgi:DNA-directed RNA polymerase specialized sigma24 family protein
MKSNPTTARSSESMTKEEFEAFLAALDPNRQLAGKGYEQMHRHLVTLFRNRGVTNAEQGADETINRVAKKLHEGEKIKKIKSYARGVAKRVASETLKKQAKEVGLNNVEVVELPKVREIWTLKKQAKEVGLNNVEVVELPKVREIWEESGATSIGSRRKRIVGHPVHYENEQEKRREECAQTSLPQSLLRLKKEERSLITEWYLGEKKEKIENKRRLAARLKCTPETLKVRACHIRQKLRRLVEEYV